MAIAAFSDDDFNKACESLVGQPDIEPPWEFFTESHDVKIYRLYNKESGLYHYQIFGTLDDVLPEVCAKVYMDIDYRNHWDSYVNELKEIKDEDGTEAIYWQINFPFFMSNRDYVYQREFKEVDYKGTRIYLCLAKSAQLSNEPERSGVVRVKDYKQQAVLCSDGKQGTKAYMYYYDNPGGSIPTMVINWAAKTGVPGFLSTMQQACRGYQKYLDEKEGKTGAS